ncbi:MAG: hypothetical protein HRT57_03025, partial [Crocinitomicaceae bacterium]|nr:hypothetical protein [Crocinitomicaceae bacterium]
MKNIIFAVLILLSPFVGSAQESDQQLAQHYFGNEEYDKASVYYERLYDKDHSKFYFNRLVQCVEEMDDSRRIEKLLKRQISYFRTDQEYQIQLAKFYEANEERGKADKIYEGLITKMQPRSRDVIGLYNAFKAQGKNAMAFRTLEKGRKLLKNSYPLNFQFAEYYGSMGETEKMMGEYLDLIDYHSSYQTTLKRILTNQIDFTQDESEEYDILKRALIERTQQNPGDLIYSELLTWLFIQRQNFSAAFIHVKAVDKRSDAKGRLVYDLGRICIENKDYRTARRSFEYIVNLGEKASLYLQAYNSLLNVKFLELTTQRNFTQEELNQTIADYDAALLQFGKRGSTFSLMMEKSHIQAFYAKDGEGAITGLNEVLEVSGLTDMQKAEAKLALGDIHVLHGDVWEAALLYMQIDKQFKYEPIGHEAKFKNARIFYYDGEFEFAQSQLDVLKRSTSKLIANDAINLSLLILENYGMDSNYIAMNWFANADLLIEQHRYPEAFVLFDSIISEYPATGLGDDIQMKKAHSMELQGRWNDAIKELEELI